MEIVCHYCQGVIVVFYKDVFKLDEEYFVTFCSGCGAENEVWDAEDWFTPEEFKYIIKYNDESNNNMKSIDSYDDDSLLDLFFDLERG